MHLIISHSRDPYLNLALENHLMTNLKANESILLLYTNSPCVVMGRFQNPWIECDLKKMMSDGVQLVRRQSGGGCVYHDEGNLNFSFINWKKNHNKSKNQKILIDFFASHNVPITKNQRDDLVIIKEDKSFKISGSAFKQKKDRAFHHGTLLFETNLELLNNYLLAGTKHTERFNSKSTKSVRSKVSNIGDYITKDDFINKLQSSDLITQNSEFFEKQILSINSAIDYASSIKDQGWLWGETPLFTTEITNDDFHIELELKKSKVVSFKISTQLIHPSFIAEFSERIAGNVFSLITIKDTIKSIESWDVYEDEINLLLVLVKSNIMML